MMCLFQPKEKEEKESKEKKRANSRGSARSKSVTKDDVQPPVPSQQMKPPHTFPVSSPVLFLSQFISPTSFGILQFIFKI